jgi:hypothetical protein
MARNRYNSGRAGRRDATGITSDRYDWIGLDQTEPHLGDPLVGIASTGNNPPGLGLPNTTFVLATRPGDPKRYWIDPFDLDTDGIQGLQGSQGMQGLQGVQGMQGRQGTQGALSNFQGTQGTQGLQGNQGVQGLQGLQGLQGALSNFQGTQGTSSGQGTQGVQGVQGQQGTQGIQAQQGTQGKQGVQGVQGLQGNQGTSNQGFQGLQGPLSNFQGTQGRQGVQGLQGVQGIANQGTQGIDGIAVNQGAQGLQGLQGLQGALSNFQGMQGNQGIQGGQGFQGIQGLQGLQGVQGVQGFPGSSQGVQGLQGIQGVLSNFQGSQGVQGVQGYQGIQGAQGVQGNQGNQGRQGLQGFSGTSQGVQGLQGTQGVQGVLSNFQGNQGLQGFAGSAQGVQGIQGAQGVQGVQGQQGVQGGQGRQGTQGLQGHQGVQSSQGTQGVQGQQGNQGVQGTQGLIGTSIIIIESIANVGGQGGSSYLNTLTGPGGLLEGAQPGNGVIDSTNNDLWVLQADGTTWVNVGDISIQGLQGAQGAQGTQGVQGVQGLQGTQGVSAAKQLGGTYKFDNTTNISTASPPTVTNNPTGTDNGGVGYFKVNNAALASATVLSIDENDIQNNSIEGILNAVEAVSNPQKAIITFSKVGDTSVFKSYFINTLVTSGNQVGFRLYNVSQIAGGSTAFTDEDTFFVVFSLVGAQGRQGVQGLQGLQGNQGVQGLQGVQGGNSETSLIVALGDEFTNVGVGTSVVTFRAPFAFKITEAPSISVSQPGIVGITSVNVLYNARFANPAVAAGWTSLYANNAVANIPVGGYSSEDNKSFNYTLADNSGSNPELIINRNDKIRFDIVGVSTGTKGLKAIIYYSKFQGG